MSRPTAGFVMRITPSSSSGPSGRADPSASVRARKPRGAHRALLTRGQAEKLSVLSRCQCCVTVRRRASQVELPLGLEAYRNTALFSDHFLGDRLPDMPFHRRRAQEARRAYESITGIFAAVDTNALRSAPEAQCEDDIIKPVLSALGHEYLVQTPTSTRGAKNFPDFALFAGQADKAVGRQEVLQNNYGRAIALAEGKHWERDLDRLVRTDRDYLTNANPSFQIVNYLTLTGKRWGVLTNGRLWRLYCRDSPQPLERFYEVDLPRFMQENGPEAFLHYFYGFFSQVALRPGRDGAHVDAVRAGSANFAEDVGDELRSRVFAALARLASGFLQGRSVPVERSELDAVYDNALILLYRMLFALYAESRELLPLESSDSYREQLSLYRLVRDVAEARERGRRYSDTSTLTWDRLRSLWKAIDHGDTTLGVPKYDGELFADGGRPYLSGHSIGDRYLADAIDLIGRVPGAGESRFVDYQSLSVAHLGTIYEGLLEQTIAVADGSVGSPVEEVVLAPIRARRRETGSYYTPSAIVRHIVAEALDPLIDGLSETEILALRICDPAMGSGHFLVAAVEHLSLAIATARNTADATDEELPGIKRKVAESCIYGVDINPLAVELAKLSLWLATASSDKPLSFLDHRLRVGNSVLTVRPADVEAVLRRSRGRGEPQRQSSVFEEAFRAEHERDLALAEAIDAVEAETVEGVEKRKRLYIQQTESRARLRGACDAAAGLMFGLVERERLEELVGALTADDAEWTNRAAAAAPESPPGGHDFRPFHWELEFPEVSEAGGFDAVLGNPPYVSSWEMTQAAPGLREGLKELPRWEAVAKRHWDLFVLFVELGRQLLRPGGVFGLIVANPLMREKYAEGLRGQLLKGTILSVTDFEDTNVFEGVARETVVMVWEKTTASDDHEVVVHDAEAVFLPS